MSLVKTFRKEVEDYLKESGKSATAFGIACLGDPGFVFGLRDNRAPRADTIDKVRAYIAKNQPEPTK